MRNIQLFLTTFLLGAVTLCGQERTKLDLDSFDDSIHHWNMDNKVRNYSRYTPDQYREIADNFIAYQNPDGGWPKNIDWLAILDADSVKNTLSERYRESTLDNTNIHPQIFYLADVYALTGERRYAESALQALEYLFATKNRTVAGGAGMWMLLPLTTM